MLITDFDGTLLTDDKQIHPVDRDTLVRLGKKKIPRAIATGRSLYSITRALSLMDMADPDGTLRLPVDFLIFSTGAGVLDVSTNQVIFRQSIPESEAGRIVQAFVQMDLDFSLHRAVPDTHHFLYRASGRPNPDFEHRLSLYADFGQPMDPGQDRFFPATQAVAIMEPAADRHQERWVAQVRSRLSAYSVVQTTSPLDHQSLWIEVFHPGVSKSLTAGWLVDRLGLDAGQVTAVGNDYNDLDLLNWAGQAFAVLNAPLQIRKRFRTVPANNDCGLTRAVTMAGLL